MPLDNPNLPFKFGEWTLATLPTLPHGAYPPGTSVDTADVGPCYVNAAGTAWLRVDDPAGGGGGAADVCTISDAFSPGAIDYSGSGLHSFMAVTWNINNTWTTSLDFSGCTALERVYLENMVALTALDLSGCTALDFLDITYLGVDDGGLATLDLSGCAALRYVYAMSVGLTQAQVDAILVHLASGAVDDGEASLGGSNAAPSGTGLAAKTLLEETRGWNINTA